jgi:hypothetical protein
VHSELRPDNATRIGLLYEALLVVGCAEPVHGIVCLVRDLNGSASTLSTEPSPINDYMAKS